MAYFFYSPRSMHCFKMRLMTKSKQIDFPFASVNTVYAKRIFEPFYENKPSLSIVDILGDTQSSSYLISLNNKVH